MSFSILMKIYPYPQQNENKAFRSSLMSTSGPPAKSVVLGCFTASRSSYIAVIDRINGFPSLPRHFAGLNFRSSVHQLKSNRIWAMQQNKDTKHRSESTMTSI